MRDAGCEGFVIPFDCKIPMRDGYTVEGVNWIRIPGYRYGR